MPLSRNDMPGNGHFATVQTPAVGTNWTAFGNQPCVFARVHNPNAFAIRVREVGGSVYITVPLYGSKTFYGISNLNQLEVQREDTSNTQARVEAEALI